MATVAVLRGGIGGGHQQSLKTGAGVISRLGERYRPLDVFIDRTGVWHMRGVPLPPERALAQADVAWNALHGEYGEDGTVQGILERAGIPYTGAKAYAAKVSLNKVLAKDILAREGIKMPRHVILSVSPNLEKEAIAAFRKFSPPVIIKPVSSGSSYGVSLAHTFDDFWKGITAVFADFKEVLVEEYIIGKEATAGVIDDFRGQSRYALLPVEIRLPARSIFSAEAKLDPKQYLAPPGSFPKDVRSEIEHIARSAHDALGLRHYSRSDFIVSPRGVYFLEVNALPELSDSSTFAESLRFAGVSMNEFTDHLITLAAPRLHA